MKAIEQSTSRRAVLAGLAAAPVTALPGLAEASAYPAPNPALTELFEEFQALRLAFAAADISMTDEECERIACSVREIAERITETPARSLADVLVKLRLYGRFHMDVSLGEEGVEMWELPDGERTADVHALLAMARDLHRLAGAPAV